MKIKITTHLWVMAISVTMIALLGISCQKNVAVMQDSAEIVLIVENEELGVSVNTKAVTAVGSIPSTLYWGATTGSGPESTKWSSSSASVSDGKINTGKYQTLLPTTYNYYLSNVALSVGENTTVTATGGTTGTDVICGRTTSSSTTPSVILTHIFARTGTITTSCANGTLSDISYTIKAKGAGTGTSGTYNLRTESWSSTSGLESATAISGSSDMYVVPGEYIIAATATYTRGDYVVTKTLLGELPLEGGEINNIALTWPDAGTEIVVNVSLNPWTNLNLASPLDYPSVDLGLRDEDDNPVLFAEWNVGATSETEYGDYFAWGEISKRYTSISNNTITGGGFQANNCPYRVSVVRETWSKYVPSSYASCWEGDGSPDNKLILDPEDDVAHVQWGGDWRMPTWDELKWLKDNCTWTWQENYKGSGVPGFLVTGIDQFSSANIFLPLGGICQGGYRYSEDRIGIYRSSSLMLNAPEHSSDLYLEYVIEDGVGPMIDHGGEYRYNGIPVRPVRTVVL